MKPCTAHRESVALLASSLLTEEDSAPVRRHLQTCAACRDCFTQLAAIGADHTRAARDLPAVKDRPQLYRRVASAIRSPAPATNADGRAAWAMGWFQIAGAAVVLLVSVGGWALFRPLPVLRPAPIHQPATASVLPPATGDSQMLAYRLALNRSPEAFEQLLTAEAARPSHNPDLPLLRNLARSEAGL